MSQMLDRITDAWIRAWGHGETTAFEELTAESYRRHSKTGDEALEEVVRQINESFGAFTNFNVEVIHAIEDDDLIAIHWRSTGKHTGEFMGVPPTEQTVTVTGASFLQHRDGKIIEESVVWDPREMLSAMQIWHLGDFLRENA
ncbi:ester cyclase [Rothia sp. AR01]|uniref:Ester cyclase n=1 Tax=Rothia santali TaxID=2949643 RepID=A0A9X2HH01_9MICC|nr:ester cyclase [Rothia santali]MCP3424698.1 ester cyclase [Rothia santali]